MDSWSRFAHTGDIRDYLAYKDEKVKSGEVEERHEQPGLYSDRNRFVCRTGRGI